MIYQELIDQNNKLAVIGLGYVGLPIALEFAKKIEVIGFDINAARIAQMQQGQDPSRELDSSALPLGSRTWLNRHLVFTNGHGFTVSPVNAAGPDGLPLFFVLALEPDALTSLGLTLARGLPLDFFADSTPSS